MPHHLIEPIAWGAATFASTVLVYAEAGTVVGDESLKWLSVIGLVALAIVTAVRTLSPVFFEQMQKWDDFKKASLSGQVDNLNVALAEMKRGDAAKEDLIEVQGQRIADQNRRLAEQHVRLADLDKLVAEENEKRHNLANELNLQHIKSLEEIERLKASVKTNRIALNTNTVAITDVAHATGVPLVAPALIDDTSGDLPTLNVTEPT